MATISEILRIEKETRANDPSNISKCYLFKEGSFIRAYEFSAWLLVNVVGDKSVNSQLKTTHKSLKDGTDFIFVGFPVVSTTKYIPSNIKIESVDDKQSIVGLCHLHNSTPHRLSNALNSYCGVLGHHSTRRVKCALFLKNKWIYNFGNFNTSISKFKLNNHFTQKQLPYAITYT